MELLDQDGDWIQFSIDAKGKLREYVNGKCEIADITWLEYMKTDHTIRDATGVIRLQEEQQTEQALGLRALAARARVEWSGDEPDAAQRLKLKDTDGDVLEFVVNDVGELQEFNNGELELVAVSALSFSFSDGTVRDDTGVFTLPARECMQKAAALRSLARQAGVPWSGDEPSQPSALPTLCLEQQPVLKDIENCSSDWEFQCPKRWEGLTPTAKPDERFCESCKEIVYFCITAQELAEHVHQRHCVAFDAKDSDGASSSQAVDSPDAVDIRVVRLSGDELASVRLLRTATVKELKMRLSKSAAVPPEQQRLLFEGQVLSDESTIIKTGIPSGGFVQFLQLPKPAVAQAKPLNVKVLMGKRKSRAP